MPTAAFSRGARLRLRRSTLIQQHAYYLVDILGPRLLPLLDLVADLARECIDGAYSWETPDPEDDDESTVIFFVAHALPCMRWTLKWELAIDLNTLTLADAQAFLYVQTTARPIQLTLF